jgi:Ni/Co efflux regulator RcnB
MNKKHLVTSALMAALLAANAPSFAQDRYHGGRDHERAIQRDRDHDRRGDRHDRDGRDDRSWQGRNNQRWDGAGPEHAFRRGDHLPPRYRHHQYVVNNYREHHLRPPPRGYQWVQTGSDYVLAAIATGVIAEILINR